jgi:hypothetical protein
MTDEVGAITGELELPTRVAPDGSALETMVSYAGGKTSTPSREVPRVQLRSRSVPSKRSTAQPMSASRRR